MKIKSRDDIIKAATDIIAFSGLDKLTMQTLSKELGINKASLYHWYGSKEEILDDVFRIGHQSLMAKGFRLSLEGSAGEVLKRAASKWEEIFTDDDTLPFIRAIFSMRYSDERAREESRALSLMIKSQVDVIIASIADGESFLSSLFSALLIEHLEALVLGDDEDFERDADAFAALLTSIQDKVSR